MKRWALLLLLLATSASAAEVCFTIPLAGEPEAAACLTQHQATYGGGLTQPQLVQILYERACKGVLVQKAADAELATVSATENWVKCGDGFVHKDEACDDKNTLAGDGCNATCTSDETCGNGVLDPGEACDDGNLLLGDGCGLTCTIELP